MHKDSMKGNYKEVLRILKKNWEMLSADELSDVQKKYEDHEKESYIKRKHEKEQARYSF